MNHKAAKAWSLRWIAQHLASLVLLIGAVLAAAAALTMMVIAVEEVIALVFAQRFINTYTNVYGNAWTTIAWHFVIVFSLVTFWSAVDTFIPESTEK